MNNVVLMTNYIMGKMRRIYFMSLPETRRDYKKSRICFTVGDSAAQTIVQLAGGTFLVTLMGALGISDGNMGIIASVGSLAAIAQIISMKLSTQLKKNKLFVCLTVLQKFWLAFIFFIPLMNLAAGVKKWIMVAAYCFAQVCIQVGTPATVDWIASLIPPKLRGRYFAKKDSVAVFVVVTVMLIMGILIDVVKHRDLKIAFVILGVSIAILVLINVISFSKMKEPRMALVNSQGKEIHGQLVKRSGQIDSNKYKIKLLKETVAAFGNAGFRKALILNCLWISAFFGASPFNASYQIKDLSLPYTYIMILSFVTSMLRVYLTPKAGRLADRIGMARVMRWALTAMGFHFTMMMLSRPGNAYVMAAGAALFSSLGWVFVGIGMLGIQLELLDDRKRIVQYALLSIISGIYGFGISFLAGKAINLLQAMELSIGEYQIYAQQITNFGGIIFTALTVLYLYTKIENHFGY